MSSPNKHSVVGLVVLLLVIAASPAQALIDLEWRPVSQEACPDDEILIGLYAVSDDDSEQSIATITVILIWDHDILELMGKIDNGSYAWLRSDFPDDGELDNLNPPREDGVPANDGNALYNAWMQFGNPAWAPPEGLLVTSFRFRLLNAGTGHLAFLPEYGDYTETRVTSGVNPGEDVTGVLGPPSEVSGCQAPTVEAEGCRYLAVTPGDCDAPVRLLVTGNPSDPGVSCVSLYVQADGSLGETPVALTPAEWGGTVHVYGGEIVPSKAYSVRAECGEVDPVNSADVAATTWLWGDLNNANGVDIDDILQLLDAFQNIYAPGRSLENADLNSSGEGCVPDQQIDIDDILGVLDAFQHLPFPCGDPC